MIRRAWSLLVLFIASVASGDTNTPFPAGTRVSVSTSAGVVTGTLQDVTVQQWIGVLEDGSADTTFIRGQDVIVRKVAAAEARSITPAATITGRPEIERRPPVGRSRLRTFSARELAAEGESGHYIHGRPEPTDDRFQFTPAGTDEEVEGITYHVREAFTIGHYNRMKVPAWVAMRWTTDDLVRSEEDDFSRGEFVPDLELPVYARTGKDLDFNITQMERGHMARDADLEAWGFDAVREGMHMSNICPQRKGKNHKVWGKLEDR